MKIKVSKKDKKFTIIVMIFAVFAVALATLLKFGIIDMNEKILFSKEISIWGLYILGGISLIISIFELVMISKIKE